MSNTNKPLINHHFQDAGSKKVKRIASIFYIIAMAFIVGGSWLHQQNKQVTETEDIEVIEFKKF